MIECSIYISLFNVEKNNFPYYESLKNACQFADEVVVAVNKSSDRTLDILNEHTKEFSNLKIIETDFLYDDILFDGKIKNAALQATTKPIKIQLDADEIVPLSQKASWQAYFKILVDENLDCLMVPTINVYGNMDMIRADEMIGQKFRIHRGGLFRGAWKEAIIANGKLDTSKSDSCELIDANGNLAKVNYFVPREVLEPRFCHGLCNYIYTIHLGYARLEHRVNINKAIWKEHWELRSGKEENVITDIKELEDKSVIYHNLSLT